MSRSVRRGAVVSPASIRTAAHVTDAPAERGSSKPPADPNPDGPPATPAPPLEGLCGERHALLLLTSNIITRAQTL